jgi:hypothetical protein
MPFSRDEVNQMCQEHNLSSQSFQRKYVVRKVRGKSVCIFQATYIPTNPARPPDDGKLREIKPDVNWLTVGQEHILPKPGVKKYPPLPINLVYS